MNLPLRLCHSLLSGPHTRAPRPKHICHWHSLWQRSQGLKIAHAAEVDKTDRLTTPGFALDPTVVSCFLFHKAVDQLLFKRTYVKDVVTEFAFTKTLNSLRKIWQMTVLILESPLESSVSHRSKSWVYGCLFKLSCYFSQWKDCVFSMLLMLKENENGKECFHYHI